MSAFLPPPPRSCSVPRCGCGGQHNARVIPLRRPSEPRPHPLVVLAFLALGLAVSLWLLAMVAGMDRGMP